MATLPGKFADFDITLTDRELEEFLSFMDHQNTRVYTSDTMPQLPDVAMDFPGLQLEPHSTSPSHSEASGDMGGSAGAAPRTASNSAAQQQRLAASDGSLTSAALSSPPRTQDPAGAGAAGSSAGITPQPQQQASPSCSPIDATSQQQQQQIQPLVQLLQVKPEPAALTGSDSLRLQQQQQVTMALQLPAGHHCPLPAASPLTTGSGSAPAASAAAAAAIALAGSLSAPESCSPLMASCPQSMLCGAPASGFCLQPLTWHSSSAITALAAAGTSTAPSLSPAAAAAAVGQQLDQSQLPLQQQVPQLLLIQTPGGAPVLQQQQQQVSMQVLPMNPPQQVMGLLQPSLMDAQLAAFAGLSSPVAAGGSAAQRLEHQASGSMSAAAAAAGARGQQRAASLDGSSTRPLISHSTVEKQRRDRLNSLIDELSDMVPPADPKYGSDSNAVRRPKHVILSDTINLLRAMQTKLQIEEAEICTLKQQTAAVGAIAASHQGGHAAGPEAADAYMHAAAAGAAAAAGGMVSPDGTQLGGVPGAVGGGDPAVELPNAPEQSAAATGVLVEQGLGCLYVKVNCKDRRGLLSDVVSALRAFPLVISTAAITTTKDGNVHDVFEVRIEDMCVTPEDIQCAVQQALFEADRARSKRTKRDEACSMQL